MQWHKPANLKYTELCQYIDKHIPDIAEPGKDADVENTVYNYLWLVVKALAIKKSLLPNFADYDGYAFYAANRLFKALRNNYNNQGKTIKGKKIIPIKSCLNYMKKLLYPMKLEFQKENFNVIISEEFTSKQFDAFVFSEKLKNQAQAAQDDSSLEYLSDLFDNVTELIDKVLKKSPFKATSPEYKKIKISMLLNACHDLTNKNKFDLEPTTIILWKLPKSMGNYVKVLLREFYTELKTEIIACLTHDRLDDATLTKLISIEENLEIEND